MPRWNEDPLRLEGLRLRLCPALERPLLRLFPVLRRQLREARLAHRVQDEGASLAVWLHLGGAVHARGSLKHAETFVRSRTIQQLFRQRKILIQETAGARPDNHVLVEIDRYLSRGGFQLRIRVTRKISVNSCLAPSHRCGHRCVMGFVGANMTISDSPALAASV